MSFEGPLLSLLAKPAINSITDRVHRKQITARFQAVVSTMSPSLEAACNEAEFCAGVFAIAEGRVVDLRKLVDNVTARPVNGQRIARRELLEGLRAFAIAVTNEWNNSGNQLTGQMPYSFVTLNHEAWDLLEEERAASKVKQAQALSLNPRAPRITKADPLTEDDVRRLAWGSLTTSNPRALGWYHAVRLAAKSPAIGDAVSYLEVWCPPPWVPPYSGIEAWGMRRMSVDLVVDVVNPKASPALVDFAIPESHTAFRFDWTLPERITVGPATAAPATIRVDISPLDDVIPAVWPGVNGARSLATAALAASLQLPLLAHAGDQTLRAVVPLPPAVLRLLAVDVAAAEQHGITVEQAWHAASAAQAEAAAIELRKAVPFP